MARRRLRRSAQPTRRWRIAVSDQAHSSIGNTLRIIGVEPLVVPTRRPPADRRGAAGGARRPTTTRPRSASSRRPARRTRASSTTWPASAEVAAEFDLWFHVDGAYGGAGLFAPSVRDRYAGIEHADSFVVDPHKWLFAPFDCAALLYRDPELAKAVHTQDASYLDVIHERRRVEPDRLRLPPDPPRPRPAAVVLAGGARPGAYSERDRGGARPGPRRPPRRSAATPTWS